jgi:hypothetical protein
VCCDRKFGPDCFFRKELFVRKVISYMHMFEYCKGWLLFPTYCALCSLLPSFILSRKVHDAHVCQYIAPHVGHNDLYDCLLMMQVEIRFARSLVTVIFVW